MPPPTAGSTCWSTTRASAWRSRSASCRRAASTSLGAQPAHAILFYREALPLLERAGRALVVNVSLGRGAHGQPWLSVYSAAKAGLIAYSQAMDKELGERGFRSCAICPGTVDTELTRYLPGPRERLIAASDVAEAVGLLLRLSPAAHVTTLVVA